MDFFLILKGDQLHKASQRRPNTMEKKTILQIGMGENSNQSKKCIRIARKFFFLLHACETTFLFLQLQPIEIYFNAQSLTILNLQAAIYIYIYPYCLFPYVNIFYFSGLILLNHDCIQLFQLQLWFLIVTFNFNVKVQGCKMQMINGKKRSDNDRVYNMTYR